MGAVDPVAPHLAVAVMLGSGVVTAAVDQASKWLVARRGWAAPPIPGLRPGHSPRLGVVGLGDRQSVLLWAVALAATLVVIGLGGLPAGEAGITVAAGLGLALGGALSNLADRLLRGAVLDFIGLWRWPTFNLADAAMVAGAALIGYGLL